MIRPLLTAAALTLSLGCAPTAHAAHDRTPQCKYEDGSGQARCVWDAIHRGNGAGKSFIIIRGGTDRSVIKYITHRRAHALATTNR